jgi:hypothetical protein
MPALYSATGKSAGDECSSTYEGRHLSLEENLLTHPYHAADGLVDKGDPVLVGDSIVGVAFKSALAATDYIAIDTEGIWFLNVFGCISDGTVNGARYTGEIGDRVYIKKVPGTGTTILSLQSDPQNYVPFGYLLGDVTAALESGTPTLVAVKVQCDASFMDNHAFGQYAGVIGDNIEVDLVAAKAAGQSQPSALGIYARNSTIMEEDGDQFHGIKVRLEDTLASTGGDLQGIRVQVHCDNEDGVWTRLYGLYVAIDNTDSSAITESWAIAIAMGGDGAAPARQAAIQICGDGTLGTLQSWFDTEIARGAGLKAQVQSLNQNTTHKIPIAIDDVIYGIPVVAWA